MALQWVQTNIGAFNGDSSRVAIFGQSAGAFSVCQHYANAEASTGLFHAAMMESGNCNTPEFFFQEDDALEFGAEYSKIIGCDVSSPSYLDCMAGLSTAEVMIGLNALVPSTSLDEFFLESNMTFVPPLSPIMPFGPVIDGTTDGTPRMPLDGISFGLSMASQGVPLVIGSTSNEVRRSEATSNDATDASLFAGHFACRSVSAAKISVVAVAFSSQGSIFVPMLSEIVEDLNFPISNDDVKVAIHHILDPIMGVDAVNDNYDGLMAQYPISDYNEPRAQLSIILRDYMFLCPSRRAARAASDSGASNVFLYQFDFHPYTWPDFDALGDYHGAEIYFIWDTAGPGMELIHPFFEAEKTMVTVMQDFVGNLAATGDVNGAATKTKWPAFTRENDAFITLKETPVPGTGLNSAVCDFHDEMLGFP